MRINKGQSRQPMGRGLGGFQSERNSGFGPPVAGPKPGQSGMPKPMGYGQDIDAFRNRFSNMQPSVPGAGPMMGGQPAGGVAGGLQFGGGGRSGAASGALDQMFGGSGGLQAGPAVTGPGGGIPGLPGYSPTANVQGIGGNNAPMQRGAPALGPGDQGPSRDAGIDWLVRLLGGRP